MKPFNLERAIAGDKIVTRDGREVRFVGYAPELGEFHRVVFVVDASLLTCAKSGACVKSKYFDLFMAPKIRTVWVNLRLDGSATYYDTQEAADDRGTYMTRVGYKAHKIEVEE